ncbi:hypothetical protein GRI89_04050 [Altererythrobacter salegens]|uniref:Lipoprotein n=1 Tax=Croceibacterium salegens TaxID=1737568 RepID=A0A6I4SS57_9SPHN|nr:hypothetical protein [Croceibacterium salegens]MXO58713.1 hypothetical protein [Croceibacterium salegens]
MNKLIATAALAFASVSLGACETIPNAPIVEGTPAAEGTSVALLQPVRAGDVVVTPMKVVEDSRCPMNARCVWAGRLIVETRVDGAGWRDTANVTLGESYGTHGFVIALISGTPEKTTDHETQPGEYRFVYEGR